MSRGGVGVVAATFDVPVARAFPPPRAVNGLEGVRSISAASASVGTADVERTRIEAVFPLGGVGGPSHTMFDWRISAWTKLPTIGSRQE